MKNIENHKSWRSPLTFIHLTNMVFCAIFLDIQKENSMSIYVQLCNNGVRRRKEEVCFPNKKVLSILRSYILHPVDFGDILSNLDSSARNLHVTQTDKNLLIRISN